MYKSINYLEFRLYFNDYVSKNFEEVKANEIISSVDWKEWISGPGKNPY